ncbi:MAG: hypothetical protein ACLPX7_08210 [Xanthobacteraceae bacterium]
MRSLIVGAVMALMMGNALAQVGAPGLSPGTSSSMQIGQHVAADAKLGDSGQKSKADDKAYGAMLKRLPDKPYDPWHGVR